MFFSKHFSTILAFGTLFFLSGVITASAANIDVGSIPYTALAPLPLGEGGDLLKTYTISTYLSGMFKLIIALGAAFAVLMGITGGIQYVASGIEPAARNNAKERIEHAVLGLVIILTSYLILNTIDPKLVQFKFGLPPITGTRAVAVDAVTYVFYEDNNLGSGNSVKGKMYVFYSNTECESERERLASLGKSVTSCESGVEEGKLTENQITSYRNITSGCMTCVNLSSSIPSKPPGAACSSTVGCQVSSQIAGKLEELNKSLKSKSIDWQVTEAWPPTRDHQASCQNPGPNAGTCVDANFVGTRATAANINTFIQSAQSAGLKAVYEVAIPQRKAELQSQGVKSVIFVEGITGEHFSVYNI